MAAPTTVVTGLTPGLTYAVSSGNSYTADATGAATVNLGLDLRDIEAQAGRPSDSALVISASGLYPTSLSILNGRNTDGSAIAASAASGKFGVSATLATSVFLISEAANSSTKTDAALFEFTLPRNYVAGKAVTLTTNVQYVLGAGTVGTHTVNANAYRTANDGTEGVDLINVSALSIPAVATDVVFTIAGATLNPGDRLVIKVTEVIQDTGGSNITSQVNSVRLS